MLFPLDRFLGVTLDILGRPQRNLVKVLLALAVNVVADVLLIRLTGNVYGAALASVLTMLTSLGYGYVVLGRYLSLRLQAMLPLALDDARHRAALLLHKLRPARP